MSKQKVKNKNTTKVNGIEKLVKKEVVVPYSTEKLIEDINLAISPIFNSIDTAEKWSVTFPDYLAIASDTVFKECEELDRVEENYYLSLVGHDYIKLFENIKKKTFLLLGKLLIIEEPKKYDINYLLTDIDKNIEIINDIAWITDSWLTCRPDDYDSYDYAEMVEFIRNQSLVFDLVYKDFINCVKFNKVNLDKLNKLYYAEREKIKKLREIYKEGLILSAKIMLLTPKEKLLHYKDIFQKFIEELNNKIFSMAGELYIKGNIDNLKENFIDTINIVDYYYPSNSNVHLRTIFERMELKEINNCSKNETLDNTILFLYENLKRNIYSFIYNEM